MLALSTEGCLIASAGTLQRLPPLNISTTPVAVDVPVIAPVADLHQPMTECAVEYPVTLDHSNPAHRKAGQMGRDRGILEKGPLALDHRDDP